MRLLVVNSTNSSRITDLLAEEAGAAASPDVRIIPVTAPFGPASVSCRSEMVVAAHGTLSALAEHGDAADAAIIACFSDPGLAAARELLRVPVVGLGEASMLTACMLGGRFSILTLGARMKAPIMELVNQYGLSARLASVRALERSVLPSGDSEAVDGAFLRLARLAASRDGAEVVILGEAVLPGVARRLAARLSLPLLDPMTCAVQQAELLARLRPSKALTGSYRPPAVEEFVEVACGFAAAFGPAKT
jgi:allantoin racemase